MHDMQSGRWANLDWKANRKRVNFALKHWRSYIMLPVMRILHCGLFITFQQEIVAKPVPMINCTIPCRELPSAVLAISGEISPRQSLRCLCLDISWTVGARMFSCRKWNWLKKKKSWHRSAMRAAFNGHACWRRPFCGLARVFTYFVTIDGI